MSPCNRLNALFIHVPKAAGMSLWHSIFGTNAGHHTPLKFYSLMYSKREFQEIFTFSIVRNPWDRLYSAYKFLLNNDFYGQNMPMADKIQRYDSFDQFVREFINRKSIDRSNIVFQDQSRFISFDGRVIGCDYLGRFESLQRDFQTICQRIGIDAKLQRHNASRAGKTTDYRPYYTDASAEVVAKVYAQDIAMLGYRFDDPSHSSLER
jgi:hypothetical protein